MQHGTGMQSKMLLAGSSRGEASVGFHEVELSSALALPRGKERCWRVVLLVLFAVSLLCLNSSSRLTCILTLL